MTTSVRIIANSLMAILLLFLAHRYLMFWHGWPDLSQSFSLLTGGETEGDASGAWKGIVMALAYVLVFLGIVWQAYRLKSQSLMVESSRYADWAAWVVRFAFWGVFLIGLVDTAISALRIENALGGIIGEDLNSKLGQAKFRGLYIHYPLLALSAFIAWFTRNLSMIWLALLVVVAEFGIVISRFIFSYEQAYMGDLVRFWYAALFLFASAYTLVEEGHVRVDVLYAGMRQRSKNWVNLLGSVLLGIPLCFTILYLGMESRQASLSSPIINYEISQSGYGLFVKYLMAGFLIIFAVSMAMQFISYFLSSSAALLGDKHATAAKQGGH